MNQFVNRIANYVANEILIKGLANSKTFQRFAVRTDSKLQDLHKTHTEKISTVFEELGTTSAQQVRMNSTAAANAGPPQPPLRGFPGFIRAFVHEVKRDFGGGK